MQIVAVLAPTVPEASPAQRSRAHRAMLEQMMLLARGHAVDSPAVRCAAEMVFSAVASDPIEFELVPSDAEAFPPAEPQRHDEPAWKGGEGYARYLRTIMSVQPS